MRQMNKYFCNLAKYNLWANDTIQNWLSSIDEAQWNMTIESSFTSIKDTCIHVVSAEHIWHERLIKKENPEWLAEQLNCSKAELIEIWKKASMNLLSYTENIADEALEKLLYYKRINGEEFEQPIHDILIHVFNHSTYHRGQLVTMLRQAGFQKVSSTDYLLYSRLG
jgi:uncharacterized damage-inducible protein DinB